MHSLICNALAEGFGDWTRARIKAACKAAINHHGTHAPYPTLSHPNGDEEAIRDVRNHQPAGAPERKQYRPALRGAWKDVPAGAVIQWEGED
jgi:hypothetical protein